MVSNRPIPRKSVSVIYGKKKKEKKDRTAFEKLYVALESRRKRTPKRQPPAPESGRKTEGNPMDTKHTNEKMNPCRKQRWAGSCTW
jgi:hypothetical protein